jgi:hypothetical protein
MGKELYVLFLKASYLHWNWHIGIWAVCPHCGVSCHSIFICPLDPRYNCWFSFEYWFILDILGNKIGLSSRIRHSMFDNTVILDVSKEVFAVISENGITRYLVFATRTCYAKNFSACLRSKYKERSGILFPNDDIKNIS